jgi:hypothetical protein
MTNSRLLPQGVVPKFPLGYLSTTAGVVRKLSFDAILAGIARHAQCDWGEVCDNDRRENEWALAHGERLFSVYHDQKGVKFWIITERDRSATTVLLPDDY